MADDTLRVLERRYRETGSAADQAAWLRERVRIGALAESRLDLAAYLGHEAARLAGSPARPPSWSDVLSRQRERIADPAKALKLAERRYPLVWLNAAGPPARTVLTRIALAAARLLDDPEDPLVGETLRAAETWLAEGRDDDEARTRCVAAGDRAVNARGALTAERGRAWYALSVASYTAYAAGSLLRAAAAESTAMAIVHTGAALGDTPQEGLPPRVLAAVRAELVAWALGPTGT